MTHWFGIIVVAAILLVLQGCTTTLSKGADRRTEGTYIDDGYIEETATSRIKIKYLDKAQVNVISYNRKVWIIGQVANEEIKTDITRIVGGVQSVTAINNELAIGVLANISSRSGDSLTTSNVNMRLRNSGKDFFRSDLVKVVTEKDVVYLLGLVTHAEADVAKEIASTSRGVKKVVPLFDYID